MRRLKSPTLEQWGCTHCWKEQSSKPQGDKLHRLRYYFCQRCGLRAKTRETPEVPWDETERQAQRSDREGEGAAATGSAI
jgi:DNA-directed RNA polymerase subunit RPC12/RpoP